MYARVMTAHLPRDFPGETDEPRLLEALKEVPGFEGVLLQRQVGSQKGMFVSFWATLDELRSMGRELGQRVGPPPFPSDTDDAYEVVDQAVGPDAASPPAFAWAGYFERLSEAQMAAHDRAGRERIKPLVEQLPGVVATYSLRTPQGDTALELVLCTSIEAIEAWNRAINSMELLPEEDPGLLTGPDRVEIYRVGKHVRTRDIVRQ
ncbi:MAG TPA: hypothetical protein VGL18_04110 [Actinomycetota bacterium]|jgi:heme-degrading monooxygenase HmoA